MKTGWEEKLLGEVADLSGRIGWKGLTAKEYMKEGPLFLSVHSLNYGEYVDFRHAYHISNERYEESPEIMLKKDDVLICKDGAGIGKIGIVGKLPGQATINSSLLLVRKKKNISAKFLYYCLLNPSFQRIINSRLMGATTPHLYQRDIATFPTYIPELKEQKRIVKILDKAFAAIDKAKENAEKNLQNSKELFESYLQSVFANPSTSLGTGPGKDWEEKRLGEVCENLDSKRIPITKRDRIAGEYPYYGASGIVDYVNQYIFNEELLLVSEDGANLLARTYPIAFSIRGKTWVNNHAHVLRFKNQQTQKFVEMYLNSIKLEDYVSGMAQPKLNQKSLNSILIPIPLLSEQKQIVNKLNSLSIETKRLESIYQQKLADLEEVKKSVLQKAFEGDL